NFHMKYIKELDNQTSPEKASINFFLKHKNDIKSIPYMFGYRILDYAFDNESTFGLKRTKGFALDLVIKKYKQEILNLFNQWCYEACDSIASNTQDKAEYFWINKFTFY
ncbi:hypothetical protein IY804_05395, partial [Campylobacter volucris]|nr:hypothetical protein [Campylobacter volucris]